MWRAISIVPSSTFLRSNPDNNLPVIPAVQTFQDARQMSIERESNFGNMEVGTEKELSIEVTNTDATEYTLIDAKFVNKQSNFEIHNLTLPVYFPADGKIKIQLFFKYVSNKLKSK